MLVLLRYAALSDDETAEMNPSNNSGTAMTLKLNQSGTGQQAAVPPKVLDLLREKIDLDTEVFASPLNAHCHMYGSAFADTDAPFGSIGSFFHLDLAGIRRRSNTFSGSFAVNPPFVELTMLQAQQRIEMLLLATASEKQQGSEEDGNEMLPLSFTVFLPHWADAEAVVNFRKSRFLRREIMLESHKHGYIDGSQHRVGAVQYTTDHDSVIFVMQNDAGHRKWPISESLQREIVAAFAPAQEATRRQRDN